MGKSMSIISAITLLSVANWSTVSCDTVGPAETSFLPKQAQQLFDNIDIEKKDGEISINELLAAMKLKGEDTSTFDTAEFIALTDRNGDGTLDLEEFNIMMGNYLAFHHGFDKDGNGKLTIGEIGEDGAHLLKADLDKSGSLDFLEYLKVAKGSLDADANKLKKDSSSGVLVSASLSCLFIILLQLF
eukprot:241008_1